MTTTTTEITHSDKFTLNRVKSNCKLYKAAISIATDSAKYTGDDTHTLRRFKVKRSFYGVKRLLLFPVILP